ncbi:bacterial transglutaminase-like family protein [Mycobacterium xenopi 4042]|uniref:Bacterial transglutaminase-like family protein n=1 Tax=Mycobacterium xenopi 4042 TaxID=1299334 RepID=X8AN14_MYCXE|nr:bacterial transglutaminase-like family protein [Mycobacterium xenopi 4042]
MILNRVETVPATRSYRYVDYWGTAVTAFDLHAPHSELTVTSSSVVETDRLEPPAEKASWPSYKPRRWSIGSTRCSSRPAIPGEQTRCRRGQEDRQIP